MGPFGSPGLIANQSIVTRTGWFRRDVKLQGEEPRDWELPLPQTCVVDPEEDWIEEELWRSRRK